MNKFACLVAFAALAALSTAAETLKIGSPAPPLKVAKWFKGTPIKGFEKGKIYVVEFWATWCGPCKVSIPHLTELAKKHKDKVSFIGVSVAEDAADRPNPKDQAHYEQKVADFVKEWAGKMEYNVAIDNIAARDMHSNWLQASGAPGIPTAYVVDKTGAVVWIGHPMMGLDKVLDEVLAGTYDMIAEAKRQADAKAAMAARAAKFKPLNDAMAAKNYAQAVIEIDKLLAGDPKLEGQLAFAKFTALLQSEADAGYTYGRKLAAGMFKGNSDALNNLAWTVVDDKGPIKNGNYAFAIEVAQMGVDSAKTDMQKAMVLDTLAYAYFKAGDMDKAIAAEDKALAAAALVKDFPADMKKEFADRLALFKSKKG
jgi:thiol-disulfide isomerase/thioredoxin